MPAIILISGAGQLGSRYLQGMVNCNSPLRIYVHDCHENSLSLAKQRWDEAANLNNIHKVSYHTSLQGLPGLIDIAIVSTTADVRATVVENISKKIDVNYWVLEKVLAQNEYDLDKVKTITSLIFLNMAPLHEKEFGDLLFFKSKQMLQELND